MSGSHPNKHLLSNALRLRHGRARASGTCILLVAVACTVLVGLGWLAPAGAQNCDDGNCCTIDTWNPQTGQCEHAQVDCSHLNDQCNSGVCSPSTCICVKQPKADGTACDDESLCTENDKCTGGLCAGTPKNCDDPDPCTIDTCNENNGQCVHTPKDCNDGIACTDDSCDPASGNCIHTPNHSLCDDQDLCTENICDPDTGCVYPPIDCDDLDLCTDDSCDPAIGCVNTEKDCSDDFKCTVDTCDTETGNCLHTPKDCSDDCSCTTDFCNPVSGQCVHTPVHERCDDQNPSTTDTCDPENGAPVTCCLNISAGDYMVGDTDPHADDGCLQFGDDDIQWMDVIRCYYCFIEVVCPGPGTACCDAMDSYPMDEVDEFCSLITPGGDGAVTWMDVVVTYYRFIDPDMCRPYRICGP